MPSGEVNWKFNTARLKFFLFKLTATFKRSPGIQLLAPLVERCGLCTSSFGPCAHEEQRVGLPAFQGTGLGFKSTVRWWRHPWS